MLDAVKTAKEMGVITLVTDYSPASPAKRIADKSYDISTGETDALSRIGKEEKIDGVFTAFEDLNTWNALKICRNLNLPFYATEKQLQITSNKLLLKDFCHKCNVPVVEGYKISNVDDLKILTDSKFPVILKPVDNYGSKGITICFNPTELKDAYYKAAAYSKVGSVIAERFFDGSGVEMYYTVIDGIPYLSAMADRYVHRQEGGYPPLPTATIFPSEYLDIYCRTMNDKVKNLIEYLEIKNGLVLFQAVRENYSFYIYEMAFRLTGEQHYHIIRKENGLDLLQMMIELSLSGKIDKKYRIVNKDIDCLPLPACNLAVLLGKGKIKNILGLNKITRLPEVLSTVQTLYEGDTVSRIGDYGQMVLRINFFAADKTRLSDILSFVNENLQVLSESGSDMIITKFTGQNIETLKKS